MTSRLKNIQRKLTGGFVALALSSSTIAPAIYADAAKLTASHQAPSLAEQDIRRMIFNPKAGSLLFRNMDQVFPSETVENTPGESLPSGEPLNLPTENSTLEQALAETKTNGFLVLHKGKIVYEKYLNGADANSRFISFSMAKSITSILVGIAIDKGIINSVNDRVDQYVKELAGTPYEGVTIRQMLMMRSGTNYTEGYNPKEQPDLMKLFELAMVRNAIRFTNFKPLNLERVDEPGTKYNYSTMETGILGLMVERASGLRLAQFTEQYLWKPLGATQSAFWVLDGEHPKGQALAGGGFNATIRDYARLGQMMLNGGTYNGVRIVSEDWVKESTTPTGTEPIMEGRPRGYQYQWWTLVNSDAYQAVGIYGQFVMVDPETETVIVKTSHWPKSWVPELDAATSEIFTQITAALKAS